MSAVAASAQTLNDARDGACTVSDFKTDGSIGAHYNAATQTLAYGRAAADGHFHAYLADADGSHERRLTYSGWPENRHQFVVEWEPSGRYLFVEVEKERARRFFARRDPRIRSLYGPLARFSRRDGGLEVGRPSERLRSRLDARRHNC
jgi:hypothetical protein